MAEWCTALDLDVRPRKETQDRLDSVVCLLIAARWRRERMRCVMIGDLADGYIVAAVETAVRDCLAPAARRLDVPIA